MSHVSKKKPQALRSTDRAGVLSMTLGVMFLALAGGWAVSLIAQTTSPSLIVFKTMPLGLAGMLSWLVPIITAWFGVLLAVSAKRYVSFRSFFMALVCVLLLLALLTLMTQVSGYGSLMDFVHAISNQQRGQSRPQSLGAYMQVAYWRYEDRLAGAVGGGALGMLVAYPLYRLLGLIGGTVLGVFALLVAMFALLRFNPIALLYGRRPQPTHAPVEPITDTQEPVVQQPQEEVVSVEEPRPAPRTIHYGQNDYGPLVASPIRSEASVEVMPRQQETASARVKGEIDGKSYAPVSDAYVEPMTAAEKPAADNKSFWADDESVKQPIAPVRTTRASRRQALEPEDIDRSVAQSLPEVPEGPNQKPSREAFDDVFTPQPVAARSAKVEVDQPATVSHQEPETVAASASTPVQQPVQPVPVKPFVPAAAKPVASQTVKTGGSLVLTDEELGMDGVLRRPKPPQQISMPLSSYVPPPPRLLNKPVGPDAEDTRGEDEARGEKLLATLASFGIAAEMDNIMRGPAVTRFAIRLGEGVKVSRVRNVLDNIAIELKAKGPIRAEFPIRGTNNIGIEVSNDKATIVPLSEVLFSSRMQDNKSPTAVALGKDITGVPILSELMSLPHLLIAGATGSGKSVCVNSIITSLLYRATPQEVRLVLIDPKFVELQPYNGMPHLLLPVITDPKKAVSALEWVCNEMDARYQKLQATGARNLDSYNNKVSDPAERMPRIIVVVDEMADLMATAGKIIDEHIKRITAKARAAGICLILATQRPSVDVITGIIKANIPGRIAFQVSSQVDSRTIIDGVGAENLLGFGDMLYMPKNMYDMRRVQGCLVTEKEVQIVTDFIRSRNRAEYDPDIIEHIEKADKPDTGNEFSEDDGLEGFDELLPKAIEMAIESGQMSISMLQRVLRVGYGRAGRLIDEMARRGIISGNEGTKARKTIMTREDYEQLLSASGES